MSLLEAAQYYREIAIGRRHWPVRHSVHDGQWHCQDCGVSGFHKKAMKHTESCSFAQAEAVLEQEI